MPLQNLALVWIRSHPLTQRGPVGQPEEQRFFAPTHDHGLILPRNLSRVFHHLHQPEPVNEGRSTLVGSTKSRKGTSVSVAPIAGAGAWLTKWMLHRGSPSEFDRPIQSMPA